MSRLSSIFCFLLSLVLIAGCTQVRGYANFSNATPQIVSQPDAVNAMLAEAATKASSALETLAAVEQAQSPVPTAAPVGDAPLSLRRAITVNWVGPVEQIAKTLADRASYEFIALGTPPPTPIVVSVDVENMPIIEVLRDIGLQMGQRANITVDAGESVVEVHYPQVPGVDGFEF